MRLATAESVFGRSFTGWMNSLERKTAISQVIYEPLIKDEHP
jgi:hypothetical protein